MLKSSPQAGSRPTEHHTGHLGVANGFSLSSATLGRPAAPSAGSRGRSWFHTPTRLIQTTGSQELASGNSPAARRLWRWQTSRGGRTAPLLRRSSGAVRLFLRQTNLGLYGAAHGIRRAVPAQGARARPFSRGDPGMQGSSAASARHALAAEWIFAPPQPLKRRSHSGKRSTNRASGPMSPGDPCGNSTPSSAARRQCETSREEVGHSDPGGSHAGVYRQPI